jgi:hypothetical protein
VVELARPCAASLAPDPEPLTRAALSTVRKMLLSQAERLSAAQTRHHPLIRELVSDMLTRSRREAGGRDLRGKPAGAA